MRLEALQTGANSAFNKSIELFYSLPGPKQLNELRINHEHRMEIEAASTTTLELSRKLKKQNFKEVATTAASIVEAISGMSWAVSQVLHGNLQNGTYLLAIAGFIDLAVLGLTASAHIIFDRNILIDEASARGLLVKNRLWYKLPSIETPASN